jgi:four helix bundle protein
MTKSEIRNTKFGRSENASAGAIRDFKDLHVWQHARELRSFAYDLIRKFPSEERYGLSSQLRRVLISVTANIAEGFGRYSYQENIQFSRVAGGSAFEVRDHLTTALDQRYVSSEEFEAAENLAQRVIQTLNGYIRSTRARQSERPGDQANE